MTSEVHEFLTRPRRTRRQINELNNRAKGLEDAMLPRGIRYDADRVQGTRSDPMLDYAERITALAAEIETLRLRYMREIRAIDRAICMIDDPDERLVLSMRYIQLDRCGRGRSYELISDEMHLSLSKIYKLHRSGTGKIKVPKNKQ